MRLRSLESLWLLLLIGLILGLPFVLQDKREAIPDTPHTLVLLSPHTEFIKAEFTRAFRDWFREQNPGEDIYLDWRSVGGTSDIVRYLRSEYFNAFRNHWEKDLRRVWSHEVESSFANPRVEMGTANESVGSLARRTFLESDCGIGVDLFFGGGSYEYGRQAASGFLVDAGVHKRHPEWFEGPLAIPRELGGEPYWDPEGRWYGVVLASFGIIYNRDSLQRLGMEEDPTTWRALTDPRFLGELGLADPTKSGASNKAFEMIIQQAMQQRMETLLASGVEEQEAVKQAVEQGWVEGLQIIQRLAANARYFTDSANKPAIDVSQGDCAAGMNIDFYGRMQESATAERSNVPLGQPSRFHFWAPVGGTTYSADPIGLLRGAPNREVAEQFIDFVLSEEGQKLWTFRVGTPGGPQRYELHRSPISPQLYQKQYDAYRYDPEIRPYEVAGELTYHPEWTGRLFRQIAFIIKVAFMDVHQELRESWTTLVEAGLPEDAVAVWSDMSEVDYTRTSQSISTILQSTDRLQQVQEARRLSLHFRDQYTRAVRIARRGAGGQ